MSVLRTIVVGLCLIALSTCADTNGVSLTLHFPNTKMLYDEWFDYSLTLSNESDHAIFILKDPRTMIECQMIFDLGTKKEYRDSHYSFDDNWEKRKAFRVSRRHAVPLNPGESYTWNVIYGYSDLHGAIKTFDVTNIAVRCLLGTNQWVRSNTVPLSFYSDEGKTVMFEPARDSKSPQKEKEIDSKLYRVRLDDKRYLFDALRQRICELPSDDPPAFRNDCENGTVTISFPKSKRMLLYSLRSAKVIQRSE